MRHETFFVQEEFAAVAAFVAAMARLFSIVEAVGASWAMSLRVYLHAQGRAPRRGPSSQLLLCNNLPNPVEKVLVRFGRTVTEA